MVKRRKGQWKDLGKKKKKKEERKKEKDGLGKGVLGGTKGTDYALGPGPGQLLGGYLQRLRDRSAGAWNAL